VHLRKGAKRGAVGIGMDHIKNEPGQPVPRLDLPVAVLGTFISDDQPGKHLRIIAFIQRAHPDHVERVEPVRAGGIADIQPVDRPELATLARRDREILALDIGADDAAGIGQKIGDHQADALARAGRGKHQHMAFIAGKAHQPLAELADDQPLIPEDAGAFKPAATGPTRRAVRGGWPRQQAQNGARRADRLAREKPACVRKCPHASSISPSCCTGEQK